MQQTPLISVIMPCYNAEKFLHEAVDSILNQTYSHFELLAINDGSTDSTLEILKEYAAKDSRIRLINNDENLQLIRSLNKGIDLAQGNYIARMDADDISSPNRFEVELHYLLQNPEVDIVSCATKLIDEKGVFIRNRKRINHSTIGSLYASFCYTPISHAPLLGKTSVFKKNMFSIEKYAVHTEDAELWGRLLLQQYQLNTIDVVLYSVRINSNSVSRLYTLLQDDNFVKCSHKHYQKYLNQSIDINLVRLLVNRINADITKQVLKNGFTFFKQFKQLFIEKENITEKAFLKEIDDIYYAHFFDLSWQILKRTQFKWIAIKQMISILPRYIISCNVRQYINKKF